jgi:hypothetical protein
VTDYQCESCSHGSNDLDELRRHSQTSHVGLREKDDTLEEGGIETPEVAEAAEVAEPTGDKFGKVKVAAKVGLSSLAAAAIGVLAWKYKELAAENQELRSRADGLAAENEELKSLAGGLLVKLAELVTENEYLKSASGAGTTLNSHRGR